MNMQKKLLNLPKSLTGMMFLKKLLNFYLNDVI